MVNNRDPYANIASKFKRYYLPKALDYAERIKVFRSLARDWIARSGILSRAVLEDGFPLLTYETFCVEPQLAFRKFRLNSEGQSSIATFKVRVKDYVPQAIANMNDEQIASLAEEDIMVISDVLRGSPQLIKFFGYEIR